MLALPAEQLQKVRQELSDGIYQLVSSYAEKVAEEKPEATAALSGRLYLSQSGWILLSVPNAVVRGLFDALDEPGVELPPSKASEKLNAHISIIRPEEVDKIGGPDLITERGHSFRYNLGTIKSVKPSGWDEMSKVWFVSVSSPELQALRRSYGLSSLPNDGKFEFHITFAVRRKKVLQSNDVAKSSVG